MKTWMKWALGALLVILIAGGIYVATQVTPIVKTKTVTLTVVSQPGDYDIVAGDAIQIQVGHTGGLTVAVTPKLGFNKAVKFTLGGQMPVGATVAWAGGDDTWDAGQTTGNLQCNVTVPLDNGLVGTYAMVLTGTSQ